MTIIVKKTKPTEIMETETEDEIGLRDIIEIIREKLERVTKYLVIIACLQLLSGAYGIHHVFRYGEGSYYHRFIYCKAETTQMGHFFEYNVQVTLGLILSGGCAFLKRPYWVVKSWYNLNILFVSFSWVTLATANRLGEASYTVIGVAIFWSIVQLVQIGFGMRYCHWGLQEFMANRFKRMIERSNAIHSTKSLKGEVAALSPHETV